MPTSLATKIQILRNGQITLPRKTRDVLKIKEGDFLHHEIQDNKIILTPQKLIDADQSWFWTREWQEGEKAADEDIKNGNTIGPFDNVKDALNALKNTKV